MYMIVLLLFQSACFCVSTITIIVCINIHIYNIFHLLLKMFVHLTILPTIIIGRYLINANYKSLKTQILFFFSSFPDTNSIYSGVINKLFEITLACNNN